MNEKPLTRAEVIETARELFRNYGWDNTGDINMRVKIERMRDAALAAIAHAHAELSALSRPRPHRARDVLGRFAEECREHDSNGGISHPHRGTNSCRREGPGGDMRYVCCIPCGYVMSWLQHSSLRFAMPCPDCGKPNEFGPGVYVGSYKGKTWTDAVQTRRSKLNIERLKP